MAQQLKLKATYLAPSKHLGRVISKVVKDALPKTSEWRVDTQFHSTVEVNGRNGPMKLLQVQLSENYQTQFACSFQAGEWKTDTYDNPIHLELQSPKYWHSIEKLYTIKGWVDIDIKKNEVSIFYEVMGNVVRDLPTALSMVML